MPTSIDDGKDWSLQQFLRHRPNTVTDIGPGSGTYARLLRPHHRGVWWTAVEIWEPYVDRFGLADLYDEVHVLDARDAPDHLYIRDLVLAGDVLEHLPRQQAVALLKQIAAAGPTHLLVSLPIVHAPQGEVDGNPHEAHQHHWSFGEMYDELAALGGRLDAYCGHTLGVYWLTRT